MPSHSNADVFIQPSDPVFPHDTRESQVPPQIQVLSGGLPKPKPSRNNEDGFTAAPSADSRSAWSPLGLLKRMMSKKKKNSLAGEQRSYLQPTRPDLAAKYAERRSFKAKSGYDHLGFGGHEARLDVSHFDSSLLRSLSAQEEQDRQMGEQLVQDEELAASLHDLEKRARARDEASLMLAIKLADGLVQDHDAFRQEMQSAQIAHVYQRENDLKEMQLQADRELVLQLQNESSTSVSDNELRAKAHLGPSESNVWRYQHRPPRQRMDSKESLAQGYRWRENTGRVDNAQRFNQAEQRISVEDRDERQSRQWNQHAEDIAYAQQFQQEFDQQERWLTEAQRVQDMIAVEDRQIRDKIIAEQAEIKRQEQEDCLICTESYHKDDMIRPCEHWYCRPCLSGRISCTRR